MLHYAAFHLGLHCLLLKTKSSFRERNTFFWGTGDFGINTDALKYTMDHTDIIVQNVCRADLKNCWLTELLCKNLAMLFHVDMIYLAKQAKRGVEKSFVCR